MHNDGTVTICCLDGFKSTNVGNVFDKGVKAVWNGEEFAKVRYYHETGQWDKVPFCASCNGWAQYEYEEEIRDGLAHPPLAGIHLLQSHRPVEELEGRAARRPRRAAVRPYRDCRR